MAHRLDDAAVSRSLQHIVRDRTNNDPRLVDTRMMQSVRIAQVAIFNRDAQCSNFWMQINIEIHHQRMRLQLRIVFTNLVQQ